jgi:hypothetical protein
MTLVGGAFLLLGLGLSLAMSSSRRTFMPTWLYLYHAAFSTFYYFYALTYGADSYGYYNAGSWVEPSPGTTFVMWFTAHVRDATGASYFDLFMLFHIFGYVGLVKFFDLLRPFREQSPRLRLLITLLIFIPGLHFWTSAIGKDAISCLGVMTFLASVHAANRLSLGAVFGLVAVATVRPHIAVLLGASWGVA